MPRKPVGWRREPGRHALAAKGIITATPIPPKLKGQIARGPEEDLRAYFRQMAKFRPHWKFEVIPQDERPKEVDRETWEKRLLKEAGWPDPDEKLLKLSTQTDPDVDKAIGYFYDVGLDYIAQEIERGNIDEAAELLAEEELSETGLENRIDYGKAMKLLDKL